MIGFKPQDDQTYESPNCSRFTVGILYLYEPLKRSRDDSLAPVDKEIKIVIHYFYWGGLRYRQTHRQELGTSAKCCLSDNLTTHNFIFITFLEYLALDITNYGQMLFSRE